MRPRALKLLVMAGFGLLGACEAQPQRYAASCVTPPPGWLTPAQGIGHLMTFELIHLTEQGEIRWNHRVTDLTTLNTYLAETGRFAPEPQIVLSIHPKADCRKVKEIRAQMARASICRDLRLCGEGNGWRSWDGTTLPDP